MKINTVIIDDEELSVKLLSKLLLTFSDIAMVGTADSVATGVKLIKELKPDLVFLDINMPVQSGFEILRSFDSRSFEVIVVSGSDHGIAAFKHEATDYLLKPFNVSDLQASLEKVEKKLASRQSVSSAQLMENNQFEKISIPNKQTVLFVKATDIVRCQGISNYTRIFLNSGEVITCSKTLLEFERQLLVWNFYRVHKSHLVNMNYITSFIRGVNASITMTDNATISVSRLNRDGLLRKLSLE